MDFDTKKEYAAPFNRAEAYVWKKVAGLCEKSFCGRLLALPISLAATNALEILRFFTIFGESAFKGAANIAASPCVEDARVWKGFKQLSSLVTQGTCIILLPLILLVQNIYYLALLLIFGSVFAHKKEKDCKDRLPKPKPPVVKKSSSNVHARDFLLEEGSFYPISFPVENKSNPKTHSPFIVSQRN